MTDPATSVLARHLDELADAADRLINTVSEVRTRAATRDEPAEYADTHEADAMRDLAAEVRAARLALIWAGARTA
jgi:hypothetical protein